MKIMKFAAISIVFSSALVAANPVSSPNKFPSGLKWKMIPEVSFNFPEKTGTPAQRAAAQSIWGSKIRANNAAFVLIEKVETPDSTITFTMMDTPSGECEPAPNGDGSSTETPMYSICPMTIIRQNKVTKKTTTEKLQNFCYLNLNDGPGELAKNHTELAYDAKTQTAYFRTIMYGKVAAECNRQIKLK